ncbi:MAG TPA: sulfatase-like hydrolase/transferase, partial [Gaiellaceae bacterium]|nr:sulfatase-like hydrolase/transferase [Gaiellaceae bacterium]
MSRRPRTGLLPLVCVLAAAVALAAAPPAGAQAAKPDIVLVLTDDQRWDSLDAMPTVTSELVEKGVTFTNAFVSNPLCCPSRASILTGLHSHSTLVYTNAKPYGGYSWFDDSSTVATWLRRAGYRTGYVGKYLNGYTVPDVPRGWDRWVGYWNGFYGYTVSVDGVYRSYGFAPDDYSTDVFAGEAVDFV